MDPALAGLQGLNLGPPGNQQNFNQQNSDQNGGNALLTLLQNAQGQQQQPQSLHQGNPPPPPSGAPLWGGGPPGMPHPNGVGGLPSPQQQQQRPPPGFNMMPPPGQFPPHMQQQHYDPLAGLPGFTSEPGRQQPPQQQQQHSPLQQQQQQFLPPGLPSRMPPPPPHQPPPGFGLFGSPRQGGPQQGFPPQQQQQQQQLQPQYQQSPRNMQGPPPPQQQQQQMQPQAQQLLDLLNQANGASGSSGNLNIGQVQSQLLPPTIEQLLLILNNQRGQQQQQQSQQQQQQSRDVLSTSPGSSFPRPSDRDVNSTTPMRVPPFRDHTQRSHGGDRDHRGGGDRGGTPHQRPSPAPGREGRWVDVMDRSHDGRAPRCNMDRLNTSLVALAESLMPTAEERGTWQFAFEVVQKVLLAKWPEGRVVLFGSAANGLSVRSSNDIDVSLQIDAIGDDPIGKSEIVEEAGKLLEDAGFKEILCLPKARVPVVKFTVPSTGTKVDITVNNTLACINTKLLADYCKVDPRLAQLVAVVKHWAKKRAVNDPYRGTLSSYCYVLMCIYHLQSRSPPVLPVLQALPPTVSVEVREWKAEFFDDVEALKGFGNENKQTLGELVWQFFEYWAWRHDYMSGVISIRTGSVLPKDEKDWTRRIGNERHLLCVEDPFELSHDLGRTVDRQTRDVMRKEFLRAATLMRDAEDPLEQVFESFKKR